ncbi:hypothetical protein RUM43_013481 [Polyplax serrata]|uniref:TPPP n=1 Tax=Polyplax serrata TaxID=468196 RepID=A0AAN8P221_POLSC
MSEGNSEPVAAESPSTTSEKENESKTKFGTSQAFKDQFKAFSKFGDTKSDGKHMTLSQSDKWMKQAKVIDGKKITTTDTGIYFKKFKCVLTSQINSDILDGSDVFCGSRCLKISLDDYRKFVEDLAKSKKIDVQEIETKMSNCGAPGLHGVSSNAKIDSTVERLTDVSKYTGSHKLRFDDSGKGKGIAGRKDIVDNSGYVSGYQNKDTYSKTH